MVQRAVEQDKDGLILDRTINLICFLFAFLKIFGKKGNSLFIKDFFILEILLIARVIAITKCTLYLYMQANKLSKGNIVR